MMRGWLITAFIFPLLAGTQKISAADRGLPESCSTGVFSNSMQAKAGTHFIQSKLKLQPLWRERKDGIWLFVEKTDTGHRYQVWQTGFYKDDKPLTGWAYNFIKQVTPLK